MAELKDYSLVLVDTCYLNEEDFFEELYRARTPAQLQNLEGKIGRTLTEMAWKKQHLLSLEKVYTLPEVVAEVEQFKGNLEGTFRYHYSLIQHATTRFHPKWGNKSNKKREKLRQLQREENAHYRPGVLGYLNLLILELEKIIPALKIYHGAAEEIKTKTTASETDQKLVGSAVSYLLANPGKKVVILTWDQHLPALFEEYLSSQPPSQLRNQLSVFFPPHKERTKTIPVKEAISRLQIKKGN